MGASSYFPYRSAAARDSNFALCDSLATARRDTGHARRFAHVDSKYSGAVRSMPDRFGRSRSAEPAGAFAISRSGV